MSLQLRSGSHSTASLDVPNRLRQVEQLTRNPLRLDCSFDTDSGIACFILASLHLHALDEGATSNIKLVNLRLFHRECGSIS